MRSPASASPSTDGAYMTCTNEPNLIATTRTEAREAKQLDRTPHIMSAMRRHVRVRGCDPSNL